MNQATRPSKDLSSSVKVRSPINEHLEPVHQKRWQKMKYRVTHSPTYVERGIQVCAEWKDDFMAFKDWAEANGADRKLTLDREDNDGNYEPDNCRWITQSEQNRPGGRSPKQRRR